MRSAVVIPSCFVAPDSLIVDARNRSMGERLPNCSGQPLRTLEAVLSTNESLIPFLTCSNMLRQIEKAFHNRTGRLNLRSRTSRELSVSRHLLSLENVATLHNIL